MPHESEQMQEEEQSASLLHHLQKDILCLCIRALKPGGDEAGWVLEPLEENGDLSGDTDNLDVRSLASSSRQSLDAVLGSGASRLALDLRISNLGW